MSGDQPAARVTVSDDEWIEFRVLAMRKCRSIADYLGELVRRELGGSKKAPKESRTKKQKRSRRQSATRVRLVDQELLTGLPHRRPQPPPWEE